jgi:luciferase family oxidoreductase group 1
VAATLDFLTEVHFGELPEPWLLASSDAGASLAAALGVPLAFAHHIKPENTVRSLERYREEFRPSRWCESPRVLLCVQTLCADTRERAAELARPMDVVRVNLMKGRHEGPFLSQADAALHEFTSEEEELLSAARERQAQGTPEDVGRSLSRLAGSTAADELMLVTPVCDLAERVRSFELVRGLAPAGTAR